MIDKTTTHGNILEGKKLKEAVRRIKELKRERNITDGMIGEIIQYHPKHVNRMLNYQAKLPEDVIIPLCEYLEVTPEYLLGHSDFKTKEEQEYHILHTKYKVVVDLLTSIKNLNLSFSPYLIWTKNETTESDRISYILSDANNGNKCREIESTTNLNELTSVKEYQVYTCKETVPLSLFLDYERNHMGKGKLFLFHEVMHNGKRTGIISHEKFLQLIDNINNTMANILSLTLGLITIEE